MKKKTILLISILAVIAAAATCFFAFRKKEQTITLVTAKPGYGHIAKSVTATGTIEPVDTVSVGAQVSGLVKKVFVDFNSVVKKGQLLAQVDPSILTAQNQESMASLANAKSNVVYQQSTFERQKQLYDLGAISKADYQVAQNQYNSAKAAVDNAGAQLKVTQKTLSYTNIYSPVDGVVLNRNVSAGQTIASSFNAPVLFVIAEDLTKMQVYADVDEADIGGVTMGQNVTFTVDAFPNDIFKGTVQEILLHPSVSANVVTYATLINVDNTGMKLKPGMTASINIYTEEDSNALLIPFRALNFKPDSAELRHYKIIRAEKASHKTLNGADIHQSHVWVKSGDTLTEKNIITSLADDTNVKVLNGLSQDEEIITSMVSEGNKNTADKIESSPFLPQARQRSAGGSRRN